MTLPFIFTSLYLSFILFPRNRRLFSIHSCLARAVCGVRLKYTFDRPVGRDHYLLVGNHISYLDIIAIVALYPASFLAKLEIASWPVFSGLIKGSGGIFVDRFCMKSRVKALFTVNSHLRNGHVCVFPEGTTTMGGPPRESHWNHGSFGAAKRAGAGVIAFSLKYHRSDAGWVDDMLLLPHLWKTLCRLRNDIDMSIKVISKERIATSSPKEISQEVFDFLYRDLSSQSTFVECETEESGFLVDGVKAVDHCI